MDHEYPNTEGDRTAIEREICRLLEEACRRLRAPSSAEHRKMLEGFRIQIAAGSPQGLEELARLVESCTVYQTPEDGFHWTADQLPVQLDDPHDRDFNVSLWARRLTELITLHRIGNL